MIRRRDKDNLEKELRKMDSLVNPTGEGDKFVNQRYKDFMMGKRRRKEGNLEVHLPSTIKDDNSSLKNAAYIGSEGHVEKMDQIPAPTCEFTQS